MILTTTRGKVRHIMATRSTFQIYDRVLVFPFHGTSARSFDPIFMIKIPLPHCIFLTVIGSHNLQCEDGRASPRNPNRAVTRQQAVSAWSCMRLAVCSDGVSLESCGWVTSMAARHEGLLVTFECQHVLYTSLCNDKQQNYSIPRFLLSRLSP